MLVQKQQDSVGKTWGFNALTGNMGTIDLYCIIHLMRYLILDQPPFSAPNHENIFDQRYLGSTLALIIGNLQILAGLANSKSGVFITGVVTILGVSAYRSAKRRRLGRSKSEVFTQTHILTAIATTPTAAIQPVNFAEAMT